MNALQPSPTNTDHIIVKPGLFPNQKRALNELNEISLQADVTDEEITELFKSFKDIAILASLETLILHGNKRITGKSMEVLKDAVLNGAMPNLTTLRISENNIIPGGFDVLITLLEKLSKVTAFSLSGLDINEMKMAKLSTVLVARNTALTFMSLSNCMLTTEDVRNLSPMALARCERLDLSDNKLDDDVITLLPDLCGANLTVLNLSGNKIGDDFILPQMLECLSEGGKLSKLTRFSIGDEITSMGLTKFAEILKEDAKGEVLPFCEYLYLGGSLRVMKPAPSMQVLFTTAQLEQSARYDDGIAAFKNVLFEDNRNTLRKLKEVNLNHSKLSSRGLAGSPSKLSSPGLAALENRPRSPSLSFP